MFQEIEVKEIAAHPQNPRAHRADREFAELVASVKAQGVIQPIVVRAMPDGDGKLNRAGASKYQCVVGHRRCRAAVEALLPKVPAVVRELSDAQALVVMAIENKDRKNLTPMEEARNVANLLAAGLTQEQAASELGKSQGWVAKRASLDRMIEGFKDAAIGGNGQDKDLDLSMWGAAHWEMVARLPAEAQEKFLGAVKELAARRWGNAPRDWRPCDLARQMADYMHLLKHAPWPKGEPIGAAPACSSCTRRSSCQPELFDAVPMTRENEDEFSDEEEDLDGRIRKEYDEKRNKVAQDDVCLDVECWKAKKAAWVAAREAALREKHPDLALVTSDYEEWPAGVEYVWNMNKKATTPGARPVLDVSTGQMGYAILEGGGGSNASGGEKKPTPVAEKKAQWDKLRERIVVDLVVEALEGYDCTAESGSKRVSCDTYLALALTFGIPAGEKKGCGKFVSVGGWDGKVEWPEFRMFTRRDGVRLSLDYFEPLARRVIGVLIARLKSYQDTPWDLEIEMAAELFGLDLVELRRRAAEMKPYPKAWRAEAEQLEAKAAARAEKKAEAKRNINHERARKGTKRSVKEEKPKKAAGRARSGKKR